MLVLTRKLGEKVIIDNNISVTVVDIRGNKVQLGINAPKHICILREELIKQQEEDPDLMAKPVEWETEEVVADCVAIVAPSEDSIPHLGSAHQGGQQGKLR